jgi:hypothetical protein
VPPNANPFPHLPFQVVHADRARLNGGGKPGRRELANRAQAAQHFIRIRTAVASLQTKWLAVERERTDNHLPNLPSDKPLILIVEEETCKHP